MLRPSDNKNERVKVWRPTYRYPANFCRQGCQLSKLKEE